jgi:hypothetical protein
LAKGDAVFPRIGKIATARQSKPRSGTTFDNRAAYRQHRSDSNDRLLRHFDLGHFDLGHVDLGHVDLAWLLDAKISKTRTVLNSNGREGSEFGKRQAGETFLMPRFFIAGLRNTAGTYNRPLCRGRTRTACSAVMFLQRRQEMHAPSLAPYGTQ